MKEIINSARVRFPALSRNESFARTLTAGFLMHLEVTPSQLADIKTVVSEAVTNAIVHGYRGEEDKKGEVLLELCFYRNRVLLIRVTDHGRGIENVEKAMEPFYTTDREGERSGMGLPIIRAFCDSVRLVSRPGFTRITMKKKL
ncbi:MAG: anti-sigma F factor [Ruminococcaceae bacterium]|nr:anti-sigma F factor [Oscillospiraceae bacterium]